MSRTPSPSPPPAPPNSPLLSCPPEILLTVYLHLSPTCLRSAKALSQTCRKLSAIYRHHERVIVAAYIRAGTIPRGEEMFLEWERDIEPAWRKAVERAEGGGKADCPPPSIRPLSQNLLAISYRIWNDIICTYTDFCESYESSWASTSSHTPRYRHRRRLNSRYQLVSVLGGPSIPATPASQVRHEPVDERHAAAVILRGLWLLYRLALEGSWPADSKDGGSNNIYIAGRPESLGQLAVYIAWTYTRDNEAFEGEDFPC